MAFGKLGALGKGFGKLGGLAGPGSPLSFGSKIAVMGHSLEDRNHDPQATSAGEMSTNSKGPYAQALMRDRRFNFYAVYDPSASPVYNNRSGCNWGKSGQTLDQFLARITEITGMNPLPAVLAIDGPTNSILLTTDDAPTMLGKINSMVVACKAAGINYFLIHTSIAIASTSEGLAYGITPAQQVRLLAVNDLIRSYCAADPSHLVLVDSYYAEAQGDGYADSSLKEDGLHSNVKGTYNNTTFYVLPAIRKLIRPGIFLPDLTNNLWTFDLASTGGTVANGVGGSAPTGTFLGRTVGSGATTCVASPITEGGIKKLNLLFSPGGVANETFRFGPGASGSTFGSFAMPTGWARVGFYVETDSPISSIQAGVYRDNTTTIFSIGGKGSPTYATLMNCNPNGQWRVSEAIPVVGPTVSLLTRFEMSVLGSIGPSSANVKISQPFVVSCPDPRLL